jgi:hypothetical protein
MNDEATAKQRFIILVALRFGGVALAFTGISIIMRRWIEPADIIGTILMVIGAFDVIVLPVLLVRRWRTPPQP